MFSVSMIPFGTKTNQHSVYFMRKITSRKHLKLRFYKNHLFGVRFRIISPQENPTKKNQLNVILSSDFQIEAGTGKRANRNFRCSQ